jgi:hypothetical protein
MNIICLARDAKLLQHSSHGPILRSVVQRLLEKRGMDWTLERGGGAFQVDALSGFDLYAKGEAVDSKVVVAQEEDFHQMTASLKAKKTAIGYYCGEMV